MAAAVSIVPASGSITALADACEITATGLTPNDATAYSTSIYPTEPAITYYFKLSATGEDDLISPVFSPSSDGSAEWPGSVIFPAAGSWTLDCNLTADDSTAATASVTVA